MTFSVRRFRSTEQHKKWWKNRKMDWNKGSLQGWKHPHRMVIMEFLAKIEWLSLLEVGVGGGANLACTLKHFKGKQLGGVDISQDAIDMCNKVFIGGHFFTGSGDDILLSDKSTDVLLSDMTYIYVSPKDIGKYLKEAIRITRNYILICEFHSNKWWERIWFKLIDGKSIYNWKKLLTKYGFYDIINYKLTQEDWPESIIHQKYCSIFMAKVPPK